ncbi:MAG: hypothetical protein AB1779_04680, partial [Candidatus Thermoplasmatota archaeon]
MNKKARISFACLGVLVLITSTFSITIAIHKDKETEKNSEVLETQTIIAEVEADARAQAYYIAISVVAEGMRELYSLKQLTEKLQESYYRYIDEKYAPYINEKFEINITEREIYFILKNEERVGIWMSSMLYLNGIAKNINELSYLEIYCKVIIEISNKTKNVWYSKDIEFVKKLETPYPLIISLVDKIESASKGEYGDIGRIVRYILYTIGTIRIANGITKDIITKEDVVNALNLAILIEEVALFRDYDREAAKKTGFDSILSSYLGRETIDSAGLYSVLKDEGTVELSKIFEQYAEYSEKNFKELMSIMLSDIEQILSNMPNSLEFDGKEIYWQNYFKRYDWEKNYNFTNKIFQSFNETAIELRETIVEELWKLKLDLSLCIIEEIASIDTNEFINKINKKFVELLNASVKRFDNKFEGAINGFSDYVYAEKIREVENWVPSWLFGYETYKVCVNNTTYEEREYKEKCKDGYHVEERSRRLYSDEYIVDWANSWLHDELSKIRINKILREYLNSTYENQINALFNFIEKAGKEHLNIISKTDSIKNFKYIITHLFGEKFKFSDKYESFHVEHIGVTHGDKVLSPDISINITGNKQKLKNEFELIKNNVLSFQPYETTYIISVKDLYGIKISGKLKNLPSNGSYNATSIDFVNKWNISLDFKIELPFYSGHEIEGIEYRIDMMEFSDFENFSTIENQLFNEIDRGLELFTMLENFVRGYGNLLPVSINLDLAKFFDELVRKNKIPDKDISTYKNFSLDTSYYGARVYVESYNTTLFNYREDDRFLEIRYEGMLSISGNMYLHEHTELAFSIDKFGEKVFMEKNVNGSSWHLELNYPYIEYKYDTSVIKGEYELVVEFGERENRRALEKLIENATMENSTTETIEKILCSVTSIENETTLSLRKLKEDVVIKFSVNNNTVDNIINWLPYFDTENIMIKSLSIPDELRDVITVEFENLNGKIEMNAPLFARYCGIDIGKYYATIHGKNFTVELEGTGIVTPDTLDEKEEEKKEMNSPTEIGTWFMAPAMAPAMAPNKPRNEFLGIKGTITYLPWVFSPQKPVPVSTVPLKGVIVKLYILDESKYKYIGRTNTGMDGKFYFTQTIPSESTVKLVIKLEDAYKGKSRVKVISNSTHKPYEKVVEYRIAEKGRDIYIPIKMPIKRQEKYDEYLFHG